MERCPYIQWKRPGFIHMQTFFSPRYVLSRNKYFAKPPCLSCSTVHIKRSLDGVLLHYNRPMVQPNHAAPPEFDIAPCYCQRKEQFQHWNKLTFLKGKLCLQKLEHCLKLVPPPPTPIMVVICNIIKLLYLSSLCLPFEFNIVYVSHIPTTTHPHLLCQPFFVLFLCLFPLCLCFCMVFCCHVLFRFFCTIK